MEEFLNLNIAETTITVSTILISMFTTIMLGGILSFVYIKLSKGEHSESFATTLFVLPMIISSVVMLIGNNIAGAFSLAGIFSIIRFRSTPGTAKDIMYILIAVAIGLSCGVKAYIYGLIFTLIGVILLIILAKTNFGEAKNKSMKLKILTPEDLKEDSVFDEVLEKHTKKYTLEKIKTRDLGSIFEFTYIIETNEDLNRLEFLNELRCRNGNMNIKLETESHNKEI